MIWARETIWLRPRGVAMVRVATPALPMCLNRSPYRQFRPKADTAAGIALHLLEDRLSERATAMVPEENRWMRWLADVLLDSEYQWAVVKSV
jgi:hypothetical protein